MPVLSQTAEYALRAVLLLAAQDDPEPARVNVLAARLAIPANYLSKTLSQLARAGVLTSTRGKRGGFRLARPPARIHLDEIVEPFEDVGRRHCLLGRSVCSDRTACTAHASWKDVAETMALFFRNTTVADIVKGHESLAAIVAPRRATAASA